MIEKGSMMSKWFVTTIGWKDLYFSLPPRGRYAGQFLFHCRCVGYFDTEAEALACVLQNHGDICECESFPYAVIERCEPGLYPSEHAAETRFFWWWADSYIEIKRPHWAENTCGWGIG